MAGARAVGRARARRGPCAERAGARARPALHRLASRSGIHDRAPHPAGQRHGGDGSHHRRRAVEHRAAARPERGRCRTGRLLVVAGRGDGRCDAGDGRSRALPLRRGAGLRRDRRGPAASDRREPVRRRTGAKGRGAGGRGPVRHVRPDGGSARPEPARHVHPHPVDAAPGRSSVAHGPAPQGERAREAAEVHVGRAASSWADGTCSR